MFITFSDYTNTRKIGPFTQITCTQFAVCGYYAEAENPDYPQGVVASKTPDGMWRIEDAFFDPQLVTRKYPMLVIDQED